MNFNLSLNDINKLINHLKTTLDKKNKVILLQGDLASGKTTLVKEYVKALNIDEVVTSPTFSLQTIYNNNIFHYDIYNKSINDFISLGLLEELEKDGLHFIEWGDEQLKHLLLKYGFDILVIKIKKIKFKREYNIES
jgi:tRNA threonylcarbamoyladenosine biosynthesis protein TsaE